MKYDFIIIGGGTAGLTTAIALQKEGYQVKVLERMKQIKELGAGLGLGANAWRGLSQLGLTNELVNHCHLLESTKFLDHKGRLLSELNIAHLNEKYGAAYFTIHRADLQSVLVKQLEEGTLELNQHVTNFTQNESGVTVYLKDGRTIEGNALIAADGIHSNIRKNIQPEIQPRYAGYTCWRGVIHVPKDTYSTGDFTETWGTKGRFGIVPLTKNRIYWFACVNAPYRSKAMLAMKTNDLSQHFQDYHSPIPELIKMTKDEELIWNDIIDLKPLNRFAYNRVLLIGDAAHATTPNMGQGAAQAIEDAIILKNAINKNKRVEDSFREFEKLRMAKTKKIINLSWRIGQAAQIQNPLLIGIRNTCMQIIPTKIQENQLESIFQTDF